MFECTRVYSAEEDLEKVVGLIGPVSVAVEAKLDLLEYTGGTYSSPPCRRSGVITKPFFLFFEFKYIFVKVSV